MSPATVTPERILRRLEWRVIRRLDGLFQGDYRTLFYGTGLDFADLREYQPRDDIRAIDWNVTARMNSPYVRQYVEDREITAWFLLDLSGWFVGLQWIVMMQGSTSLDGTMNCNGSMYQAGWRSWNWPCTLKPSSGGPPILLRDR